MDYQEESSEEDKEEIQDNSQENNQENSQEYFQEGDDVPNLQKSDGPKKGLWVALFISLFILLFLILFVASMQHDTSTISKNEIIKGEQSGVKENDSLKFKFGGEEHSINIGFLGVGSVDLVIESEPIKAHILINETQFFDINNDSENDLRIKLMGIKSGKAILLVKRIDGEFCVANFQCKEWGECSNRIKKRKCADLNECGKEKSKPKEEVFCIEDSVNPSEFIGNGMLNCSDNNAVICNSSEKCNGNLINSSDSLRCCIGSCTEFQLNESVYSIFCNKDISYFKEASENCTSFTINCSEQTIFPALGLVRNFNSTFELQGYSNGSCIFYYGYNDFSINYSNEKFNELLEKGKTFEQINFEIKSLDEGFSPLYIGKNLICYYPINDLNFFLDQWEKGKETWSLDLLGKYECSGTLSDNFSEE